MGSILRQDYFGDMILIASNRKFRPKRFERVEEKKSGVCVFCPGNENLTPQETDRVSKNDKWIMRRFPNKFPFSTKGETHQVIIETEDHNKRLSSFSEKRMSNTYEFYQKSVKSVKTKGYIYLFKNEGSYAGASVAHSHSQLVGLPRRPQILELEKKYLNFEKILKQEEEYIILEDDNFFTYSPKASKFPLECWIVNKRKSSSLSNMSHDELFSVSKQLLHIMKKLDKKLAKPSFNLFHHDNGPNYHVHVVPRITTLAGMEIGLNTFINEVKPEEAVRFYKK